MGKGSSSDGHLAAVLRAVQGVARAIAREHDPDALLREVVAAIVASRGFDLACVVRREGAVVRRVVGAGDAERLAEIDRLVAGETLPACLATALEPVAAASLGHREGCAASAGTVALPLACEGESYGALVLGVPARAEGEGYEREVMAAMAEDVAFGLHRLAHDVSERRQIEDALRLSEQEQFVLFDLAPVGITHARAPTGEFLDVNRRFCAMLGYSADELRGRRFVEITHPDDRAKNAQAFGAVVRGELPGIEFEKRYLRKDGSICWCRVNVTGVRDASGAVTHSIATMVETTDRRRAEAAQHLQTSALQAAANGIVITDLAGTVVWVNDALCALTGYAPDELVGQSFRQLRSGVQGVEFYREMWGAILAGRVWHGELVNRRKDGSLYEEEMTITPVQGEGGAVTHFVAIKNDVSARNRAAEGLRVAQRLEAVGQLAGGVAHDFNNLLSVILSYTELAVDDLRAGDPLRADLEQVVAAARRAAVLTRQLLAFSRRQVLEPEAIDVDELLADLAQMLGRLIGETIAFEVNAGESRHPTHADRGQLEQVVMNLVVNARDAMPGGGTLTVETATVQLDVERARSLAVAPGVYVELAVRDTGTGMDEATRARIFEPFFTTKAVGKGTGLGLAMAHGIVKQSGGGIEVESAPGRGSTFRVYLPLSEGDAPPPPSERRASERSRGHESVLVVEDEPVLRVLVRRMLVTAGYRVEVAANAGDALLYCERHGKELDLLLTDLVMPGMDGCQLADRLAPLCPGARVLFMSGYSGDVLERHDLTGRAFLPKPFDVATLTGKVRQVLDGG